jgi:hypothetical protein
MGTPRASRPALTPRPDSQDLCRECARQVFGKLQGFVQHRLSDGCILLVWARDIENVRVGVATGFAEKVGRLLGE